MPPGCSRSVENAELGIRAADLAGSDAVDGQRPPRLLHGQLSGVLAGEVAVGKVHGVRRGASLHTEEGQDVRRACPGRRSMRAGRLGGDSGTKTGDFVAYLPQLAREVDLQGLQTDKVWRQTVIRDRVIAHMFDSR